MVRVTRADQEEFVREAVERIEHMREAWKGLAGLSAPELIETFNLVFRDMHSLKGAAQVQNLKPVALLAHRAEDFLSLCREKGLAPDDRGLAIFLASLEHLQKIIENLQVAKFIDVSPLVQLLEDAMKEYRAAKSPG